MLLNGPPTAKLVAAASGRVAPVGYTVRKLLTSECTVIRWTTTAVAPVGTAPPVTCRLNVEAGVNFVDFPPVPLRVSRIRTGEIGWKTDSPTGDRLPMFGWACCAD